MVTMFPSVPEFNNGQRNVFEHRDVTWKLTAWLHNFMMLSVYCVSIFIGELLFSSV